jgi:hypothetical protein
MLKNKKGKQKKKKRKGKRAFTWKNSLILYKSLFIYVPDSSTSLSFFFFFSFFEASQKR